MLLPLLPALSALVLAAHFLRAHQPLLMLVSLALLGLMLVRRPWASRTLQVAFILGALEWVRTAAVVANERFAVHGPWIRAMAIFGFVATVTLLAAAAVRSARARRWFRIDPEPGVDGAVDGSADATAAPLPAAPAGPGSPG